MNDDVKKLLDFMDEFDDAMLTTCALDGSLRARPMRVALHRDNGDVLFVTSIDSAKVDEVLKDPEVNVTFQKNNTYLSISGRATLRSDRQAIDEVWNDSMKIWFPEGKDSEDLAVVEVRAHDGEYWNLDLRHRFQFLVQAGKALVTGEKPYENGDGVAGEHEKVDLGRRG